MPGRVTGTIGTEEVRLENAATESTLELLVEVMNDAAKKLGVKGRDFAKELKGLKDEAAARDDLTDQLEDEENKRRDLNKELDENKKKFKNFVEDLDGIMQTLSAGIGKIFSDATPTIGGFAKAFDGVPVVGGIISTFGGILDNNIKTFRDLAGAGIDLGEGLYAAQTAAANAGISLETFARTVAENSVGLAAFGGSASQGAIIFSNVMGGIKKSGALAGFGRLGMSMEEVAANTASYMEVQAQTGRGARKTQAELTQGAIDYNLELDKMSRATGVNRKAIDEQNKQMARDAKMKMVLGNLSEEERTAFAAKIAQLNAVDPSGKLSAGLIDMVAAGGQAITKESQMLLLAAQDAGVDLQTTTSNISKGVKGSVKGLDADFAQIGKAGREMSEENRALGAVLATQQKDSMFYLQSAASSLADTGKATDAAAEAQAKALQDAAKDAATFDQQLVEVQNNLKQALIPILKQFAAFVSESVIPALKTLSEWLEGKNIGEVLLGALVAGIGLMFAKAAAARVLENAVDKLMGKGGGAGGADGAGGTSKGKGRTGKGRAIKAGVKGLGVGTVIGVGADLAADALGRETTAGAGMDVLGSTASYAGTGAMIGCVIPGLGTAVGGAIGGAVGLGLGLYEHRKTLFGTKEPEVKVDPKLANDWAYSVMTGKASFDQVPEGYQEAVLKILENPPTHWISAPAQPGQPGAPGAGKTPATPGAGTTSTAIPPEAIKVAETKTADEVKSLAAALKDVDYNKLIMPEEAIASMTTGTVEARNLRGEVIALSAAFKDLDNTGLEKITSGLARLDESFKSFNKSFVEDFMAKFKELDKKSQEALLTDINDQMEKLNIGMATLIDVQQGAATGISKTARYTKQSTGNMIG